MPDNFFQKIRNAWNAFSNRDPTDIYRDYVAGSYSRPDRTRPTRGNERSIISSVYNRIAMDSASIDFQHVKLDANGRFTEVIDDSLNRCLTLEANIDQSAREFIQDAVMSMLDEGCVALVPIDVDRGETGDEFHVETMRVGKVTQWYPREVEVDVYNDRTGLHERIMVSKETTPIIENPFYAVMNEPNAVVKRLARKLNLLDVIDEQSGSGKLDLIIQLPYVIKSEAKRDQAERRRKDIEAQLTGSKYGIAYTDGTERITQLNRPVENNLMHQIEYLTELFHSQMGTSQSIMDGSADEHTMLNYYTRSIEPIVDAIANGFTRKSLTETERDDGEAVQYFRDPFKLVPVASIAEIADKFTRNEIMSSNEIRQIVGYKPADDPGADELRNKNLSQPAQKSAAAETENVAKKKEEPQNGE